MHTKEKYIYTYNIYIICIYIYIYPVNILKNIEIVQFKWENWLVREFISQQSCF